MSICQLDKFSFWDPQCTYSDKKYKNSVKIEWNSNLLELSNFKAGNEQDQFYWVHNWTTIYVRNWIIQKQNPKSNSLKTTLSLDPLKLWINISQKLNHLNATKSTLFLGEHPSGFMLTLQSGYVSKCFNTYV